MLCCTHKVHGELQECQVMVHVLWDDKIHQKNASVTLMQRSVQLVQRHSACLLGSDAPKRGLISPMMIGLMSRPPFPWVTGATKERMMTTQPPWVMAHARRKWTNSKRNLACAPEKRPTLEGSVGQSLINLMVCLNLRPPLWATGLVLMAFFIKGIVAQGFLFLQ